MKWHSSHQQQKTHYLWFGDQLVGIRDECNEEHTHTRYWHYDGWDLLAQQFIESDDNDLTKVRTDWAVSDPTALPLRFYNQTGQLTWQSPKRTLWGKAYLANDELGLNELRFAGQQYDAESGLCYNRFRYYHPDSGCYLSPDPLGLMGGLNTHAYVPNPTGWIDPLGLAGCDVPSGKSFEKWFNSKSPQELADLYKDKEMREIIKSRLRHGGGDHEWLMVSKAPQVKSWGCKYDDIVNNVTSTKSTFFRNPNSGLTAQHGTNSISSLAHKQIGDLIDSSSSFEQFQRKINNWAEYSGWLPNGRADLPSGLIL